MLASLKYANKMFYQCFMVVPEHLMIICCCCSAGTDDGRAHALLFAGMGKRGAGTNEQVNNKRVKFRRAAVDVTEILPELSKVAACFSRCTKILCMQVDQQGCRGRASPYRHGQ